MTTRVTEFVRVELPDAEGAFSGYLEQVKQMPSQDALPKILSGEIRLSRLQNEPPLAMLAALSDRIEDLDLVGRTISPEDTLPKLMEKILRSGARQEYVEGNTLNWRGGLKALTTVCKNGWVNSVDEETTILDQLKSILDEAIVRQIPRIFTHRPTPDYIKSNRLVDEPYNPLFDPEADEKLYPLPPDWFAFHCAMEELKATVERTMAQGLQASRILAVDDRPNGAVLLPPSKGLAGSEADTRHYLLTRDLPEAWLGKEMPRHKMIVAAVAWLERVHAVLTPIDKRLSRADGLTVMKEKFGLSNSGAADAWSDENNPWRGASGAIPAANRININVIREIE